MFSPCNNLASIISVLREKGSRFGEDLRGCEDAEGGELWLSRGRVRFENAEGGELL